MPDYNADGVRWEDLEGSGIRLITIDRNEVKNAIDFTMACRIKDLLQELDEREDLRIGVLTGSGGMFSAGMNLKDFQATGREPWVPGHGFGGFTMRRPRKPLIAAVEGGAIGGGFEMALASDILVSSTDAFFALPEVTRGLAPGGGGMLWLSRRLPTNLAMELVLTGGRISAQRAFDVGLVNRLESPGSVLDRALEIAGTIASNSPTAVGYAKEFLLRNTALSEEDAWEVQRAQLDVLLESADALEGAAAFKEKRDPQWSAPETIPWFDTVAAKREGR